ncbi:hypothetical protein HOLleu_39667 [Holothuria leucospilota]|uniref:Uncharacterized protein n=1 Tax=Holothuria leucospilota TaxID=206669 RepID=A0A9Q0YER6_HOLLE|nr:hypothetical protein HOLleu_39667 [Holothuria leucospilota]
MMFYIVAVVFLVDYVLSCILAICLAVYVVQIYTSHQLDTGREQQRGCPSSESACLEVSP